MELSNTNIYFYLHADFMSVSNRKAKARQS